MLRSRKKSRQPGKEVGGGGTSYIQRHVPYSYINIFMQF